MWMIPIFPSLPVANMIYAFTTSNFFSGKLIVTILFAASIVAWSVMVTKHRELKRAQLETQRFLAAFRAAKHPLALFLKGQKYPHSPVYKVYEGACTTVGIEMDMLHPGGSGLFFKDVNPETQRFSAMQIGAVRNAAERSVADQALVLENKMGFLATAVSASPLLGLLGTVWGVMDAFSSMAAKGMANISAVAPGIAGALLTTVVGLLVAIPSAIGYNMLANRIRHICVQMDNFTDEFVAEFQRHFGRD